jgi:hypothetical protein
MDQISRSEEFTPLEMTVFLHLPSVNSRPLIDFLSLDLLSST